MVTNNNTTGFVPHPVIDNNKFLEDLGKKPPKDRIETYIKTLFGSAIFTSEHADEYTLHVWARDPMRKAGDYFFARAYNSSGNLYQIWEIARMWSKEVTMQHTVLFEANQGGIDANEINEGGKESIDILKFAEHFKLVNASPPLDSAPTNSLIPTGILSHQFNVLRMWNSLQLKGDTLYGNDFFFEEEQLLEHYQTSCLKEGAVTISSAGIDYYLHANKIGHVGPYSIDTKYQFIASQYPTEGSAPYFWLTAFRTTHLILDLVEHNSTKITHYYPKDKETKYFSLPVSLISVNLLSEEKIDDHIKKFNYKVIVNYKIDSNLKKKPETKTISRIHFIDWPDMSVISLESLEKLVSILEEYKNKDLIPNLIDAIVHCWIGIGRTGTVIAALLLKEAILKPDSQIKYANLTDKIEKLILNLRRQRDGFVQSPMQLQLLYDFCMSLLFKPPKK